MLEDMARIPFVRLVRGRSASYPYFRTKETGNVRMRAAIGTPDFHRHYAELVELRDKVRASGRAAEDGESFTWLIDQYLKSAEFKALADTTQLDYGRTCDTLKAEMVDPTGASLPYRYCTRAMLKAVRDGYAATPRKAHKLKQMLSRLYSWADESELVPAGFNPAAGFKRLKRQGGDREYVPWSDPELDWILGSAPAHVVTPVLLALHTGQRREDIVTMTWQQFQGDLIRVRTSKTRELLEIPCHPTLKAHLEALRKAGKVVRLSGPICRTDKGEPFATANALSGALRRAVERDERVPNNRSFHGIRYASAARMEEAGATIGMLELVLGHRTLKMALKYASRRRRQQQGVARMKGE
jgi:integrase